MHISAGGVARRMCEGRSWSAIDFSECTVVTGSSPFLLLWLPFMGSRDEVLSRNATILAEVRAGGGIAVGLWLD